MLETLSCQPEIVIIIVKDAKSWFIYRCIIIMLERFPIRWNDAIMSYSKRSQLGIPK